jgi:DNA repair exonuclease SbcCD ATPase subunit
MTTDFQPSRGGLTAARDAVCTRRAQVDALRASVRATVSAPVEAGTGDLQSELEAALRESEQTIQTLQRRVEEMAARRLELEEYRATARSLQTELDAALRERQESARALQTLAALAGEVESNREELRVERAARSELERALRDRDALETVRERQWERTVNNLRGKLEALRRECEDTQNALRESLERARQLATEHAIVRARLQQAEAKLDAGRDRSERHT